MRLPYDEPVPTSVLTELEARAQTRSLDALHHERRVLLEQLAPLKALHGHNGMFDDKRKQMLEAMKVKHRISFQTATGQRPTDAAIEALAYDDKSYLEFIDAGISARIDYIRMQNELDEINEKIRSREIELLAYNSELRLAK
jgi:hypothetical protein